MMDLELAAYVGEMEILFLFKKAYFQRNWQFKCSLVDVKSKTSCGRLYITSMLDNILSIFQNTTVQ